MRKKTVRKKDDGPALPTPHGRSVAPWRYLVEGERDAPARDKLIPGAIGVTRDRISPDGRMMRVH